MALKMIDGNLEKIDKKKFFLIKILLILIINLKNGEGELMRGEEEMRREEGK